MKKAVAIVILTAAIAAGVTGCKKVFQTIFPGLDADVPEIVVTIPYFPVPAGTPVPSDELSFPPYTQPFNLDSTVRANTGGQFGAGDVTSVKVKQIVFTIKNPDSANNLSNFVSARFTFQSNSNTTPVPVASFTFPDIYATTTTFIAPADTPELKSYITGTQLTYNVFGRLRRFTTKNLKVAVLVTIRAK